MAIKTGKRILWQTKREVAEKILGEALGLLGNNPEKNARYIVGALDYIARGQNQQVIRDWIRDWLSEGRPGRLFLGRMLKDTGPNVRQRYIARMIVSILFRDPDMEKYYVQTYGVFPPFVMLISPTMRCNFSCRGCYAASYERSDDMRPEVLDRVIGEAEAMGTNFVVLLGGEPFLYPGILDILQKHNRSFFQIYTNGSLIDREMADRLAGMGNIAPQLSINGPEPFTDNSRQKGAFRKVTDAMDNLHRAGCVFGFSTLVTRQNAEAVCSDEWIDWLIKKGALYGWYFLYMPVGDNPDVNLMPTPEQRDRIRLAIRRCRETRPLLPADFWSDGTLTGGCIAGGRVYFHINCHGDVEPCIFCHFSTHNVNESSLVEALSSPFFKTIREGQPFGYNTLRPCPMIDHPQAMWRIIRQNGARPTHPGAETMFTSLAPEIENYAFQTAKILDGVWDNEDYHDWAGKWEALCGISAERFNFLREEYEESRKAKQTQFSNTAG